jgi:hypothetical protein
MSQNVTGVDGVANSAWTLEDDNITTTEGRSQAVNLTNATSYSFSVFIKKTTGTPTSFPAIYILNASPTTIGGCVINTTTGATTSINSFFAASILSSTNTVLSFGDFWKVTTTVTINATASWLVRILPSFNADGSGAVGVAATGSAVFWGAQLEAGSFPTSYIPTTTGTLARGADVCNITGGDFNNFYNQSEGTLFADVSGLMPNVLGGNRGFAVITDGTYANKFEIVKSANISSIRAEGRTGSVDQFILGNDYAPFTQYKVALGVKTNDTNAAFNGSLKTTDTSVTLPSTMNRLEFRDATGGVGGQPSCHLAAIRYYKKRLPNAKLAQLTV